MNKEKVNRVFWADVLRITAIFCVVIQHYCPRVWDRMPANTLDWQLSNALVFLTNSCVPVFVMISGMFFLNPEKRFSVRAFFEKNMLKLLVLLFFWGIVCGLVHYLFLSNDSFTVSSIISPLFYKRLPYYHLWFLYMLIGLYLLVPVLRIYTRHASQRNLEYFLLLFFIALCIKLFNQFMPRFNFNLPELLSYTGYFVAGYYFSVTDFSKRTKWFIYFAGFVGLMASIYLTYRVSMAEGARSNIFKDNLSPLTMLYSYAFFLFFKENVKTKSQSVLRLVTNLSACVLGIYLVHDFFIQYFSLAGFTSDPPYHFLFVRLVLLGIVTFILSWGVVLILKRIPFIGKWIV